MRRLFLCFAMTVLLAGKALFAQDVSGMWQGTLHAGKDLRIVLKIARGDDGVLKGTFYSIDQGASGTTGPITARDKAIKFEVPANGGTFEGTMSPDSSALTGTWKQGDNSIPLELKHVTPETAWAIPEPPARLPPMAANADPSFEVATIKPSKPDQPGKAFLVRGRRFSTINTTLDDLITFAYALHVKQITGGPAWLDTDKFDIDAQPDVVGQPNDVQLKSMVRKLIVERFKLTFHHDKKELSVYALTLGKTGQKLTKSDGDPNGLPGLFFRGLGQLHVTNATMSDFASLMQSAVLDRPVVDQTGLAGRFNFTLNWTPDESQFGGMGIKVPPPSDKADAPPGLFTAIQEQMGMRLDPTRTPVDVLVIDHVEKPSAD